MGDDDDGDDDIDDETARVFFVMPLRLPLSFCGVGRDVSCSVNRDDDDIDEETTCEP